MGTKHHSSSDLVSDNKKRRRTAFSKIAMPWQEQVSLLYHRLISSVSTSLQLLSSWLFPVDSENINNVHLVEEIMGEILSRLPVKSLLRFRYVSRSWLSLIDSEWFIATHLQNSIRNRAFSHHRIIFRSWPDVWNGCSLHQLLNEPSSIGPSYIHDPTNFLMKGDVMGCCNGLICLHQDDNFFLLNPTTRTFVELPNFDCDIDEVVKFGFGWDETSGAYKVIVFFNNFWGMEGCIYSSRTNSWKTIEQECDSKICGVTGVFACGNIYWIYGRPEDYYIESFDLKSEEFGRIEPPCESPKCKLLYFTLGEIGGCLHLLCVHDDHHQQLYTIVWVMNEFGWSKLFTLPLSFKLDDDLIFPLFGGGPNGEILLKFETKYLVYEGKDAVVRAGENKVIFWEGYIYVESLVSPFDKG